MYWTDYIEDVVYRANLTTGEDIMALVTEHLSQPGIQTVERGVRKRGKEIKL